jgi:hypothetical protein
MIGSTADLITTPLDAVDNPRPRTTRFNAALAAAVAPSRASSARSLPRSQ